MESGQESHDRNACAAPRSSQTTRKKEDFMNTVSLAEA